MAGYDAVSSTSAGIAMSQNAASFDAQRLPQLASPGRQTNPPKSVKAEGKADKSARFGPLMIQLRASNQCGLDALSLP
jgi:hypothetical protein